MSALALAALLAGCGGTARKPSARTTRARSSSTSSTASQASSPAPPPITAATGGPPPAGAYWPYAKLIGTLAGRTVTVSNATVRLNPALVECNGDGAARQTGGARGWTRYTCTQTIFQGGADHDVTFDVTILGARRLRIGSARTGPE